MLAFALYNSRFDIENLQFSVKMANLVEKKNYGISLCDEFYLFQFSI